MIATLEGMLDELCSPDMTLSRSRVLRPRLIELLETMNSRTPEEGVGDFSAGKVGTDTNASARQDGSQDAFHREFTAIPNILQGPCVG
jgi:hypothetical protein